MCENPACHHSLEHHPRHCEKCKCKEFVKDEYRIYLFYDNCGHNFINFLERHCPSCKEPTTMLMGGYGEVDPFHIIKLDDSEYGLQIKTVLHNCGKCGLISTYDVEMGFDTVLHDLMFKAQLAKREKENKIN